MKSFLKNPVMSLIFASLSSSLSSAHAMANDQILVDCPPVGTEAQGLGYSAQVVLVGSSKLVGTISKLKNGISVPVHTGTVDKVAYDDAEAPWGVMFLDQSGTFAIKISNVRNGKPGNGELGFNGININLVATCTLNDPKSQF